MNGRLVFDLHTWWHAGTGRGDGALVDAVVARTAEGLPVLPGKTVKGLVREACTLGVGAGLLTEEQLVEWFGTELPRPRGSARSAPGEGDGAVHVERARYQSVTGTLAFASATPGEGPHAEQWVAWARAARHQRDHLFGRLASTAIDDRGLARDGTLRATEVAVPMRLSGAVGGLDSASTEAIQSCLLFVRGLGSHRNRGLGRVTVTLEVQ